MGDAVLSAFMQVVFEQLASPIVEEFGSIYGVEKQLKKLSRIVMRIRAVTCDAEQRQIREEAVRIWLSDLKEVAYDADDILDEMSTEILRSRLQVGRSFLSSLSPNPLLFRLELASKIDEVIGKFEDIARERDDLHLREGFVLATQHDIEGRFQSSSLVDESCVVGRTDDREKIVSLMLSDDGGGGGGRRVSVIPIVGIGGVGKTTLAQIVYNDDRVQKHFELRMWVCVFEEFDPRMITKAVIESATGIRCDLLDMDPMQRRLQEVIKEKRYLLVLDDIWNENYNNWDVLRIPFGVGAAGSKIIITTRSEVVSSVMGTIPSYTLKGLSKKDCWSLFKKRAFLQINFDAPQNLVKIGKKIVNKCEGLPLAVKELGGLLSCVTDENEWDVILKSEIWDLPKDKNAILPTLRLSYNHLPSHLRQCFGLCSIFLRDHVYKKDDLVLLWMALGFIQPQGMKEMEDIGGDYFHDLLSMSFFYYSHIDPLDGQPRYRMHGLIHDLSHFVTHGECFTMSANKVHLLSKKSRHFSINCDNPEPTEFATFSMSKTLRTLLLLGGYRYRIEKIPHDLFLQLKCLRVLDFSHTKITELPSSIGNLKHLRYLDLSWTCIRRLPESLCGLCNLQTLKLIKCVELHALPDNMSSLINLRHLNISFSTALLKILPFANRRLLDLPKSIKNLINLRDIDTSFGMSLQNILPFVEKESCLNSLSRLISTPPGMGKLTCLQTLSNFVVTKRSGCGVEELKSMVNLRGSLCISKLENVVNAVKAKEADLKSKHRLHKLTLQWNAENPFSLRKGALEEEVIECLQPHKNVKDLRIENFGGTRFPSWMMNGSLSNLVSVCIFNCQDCNTLPSLWQLPFLKDLKIHGIHGLTYIGHEFYGDGVVVGFPSLEMLEVKDMPNLESWSGFEAGAALRLCELTIWDCPKMRELSNLPSTLLIMEIANCHGFSSLPMLQSIQNLVLGQCDEVILNSLACFTCLSSLTISSFSKLRYLPDGLLQHLTSLEALKIIDCGEFTFFTEKQCLQKLSSLECLEICSCPQFKSWEDELLPKTLKSLRIVSCTNLTSLPGEMQHLSNLQFLEVWNCPQINSLPACRMPLALQVFWVRKCPSLKERCHDEGEDWLKISHIPSIRIDLEWIQQN